VAVIDRDRDGGDRQRRYYECIAQDQPDQDDITGPEGAALEASGCLPGWAGVVVGAVTAAVVFIRRRLGRWQHARSPVGHATGRACILGLDRCALAGHPSEDHSWRCRRVGSSALYTARKFIQRGLYDCVLAVGSEKMDAAA
jgi:hypothetical protein